MFRSVSTILVVLLVSGAGRANAAPSVADAIRKGREFLAKANLSAPGGGEGYGTGPICLAALALLETGTPPSDPLIQSIAQVVREAALRESKTYQISLDILFLDRLGESADIPLIQVLGCRLLAGQNANGGWSYSAFAEINENEVALLRNALASKVKEKNDPIKGDPGFGLDPDQKKATAADKPTMKLHPVADRIYQDVRRGMRSPVAMSGGDDNSNTQFGLMGVWVSTRKGVPTSDAIRLLETRFVRTQSPTDFGWSYSTSGASSPSMTCAGMLGLAVGKALAEKKPEKPVHKPNDDDPFFSPPMDDDDENKVKVNKAALTVRDRAIERGLMALGALLRGNPNAGLAQGQSFGGVGDLYFFWSLERVAVAYGVDTIAGVDWYKWGSTQILATQQADGSWTGSYNPVISTSFAILFLSKANLTTDLTRQINGKVKDPGGGEMRGTRGSPLTISARGRSPEEIKAGPDLSLPTGPNLNAIKQRTKVDQYVNGLLNADDKQWKPRLDFLRDRKGPELTLGLVLSIPQLEGSRQFQARQALAERLTRMTPETLRKLMLDRDAELRRGATLACAMRDERVFVPDLIERLTDIDDSVVRAARAGLKSLTAKDFGPANGSSDEQKRKAANDWRFWWASEGRNSK